MNYEEYLKKGKELQNEFKGKELNLMKEYVTSNNPHKVGDKVTDHKGSILIKNIGFTWGYNEPCATYTGLELNNDGSAKKKEIQRTTFQSNII